MAAIPSLSSAFSLLQSPTGSSPAPINWGAINVKPPASPALNFGGGAAPAVPSLGGMQTSTPATATPMTNFANPPKPAVPAMGNLQSNDTALRPGQFGAGPFATIKPDGTSTPSAYSQMPALPSITPSTSATPPTPSYTPAPYTTTNSGATVDPNTGSVVSGSPQQNASAGGPAVGSNTGNATGASSYSASAGGAPALPYTGGGSYNPLITNPQAEDLFKKYQSTLTPSADEVGAMTRLNALNTSAATAYTNTENQPIPLPFITGQQAALQRSQNLLATPLESQISLMQAQRTMAGTASKAALDRVDAQIAAARELAKPVATSYGGTLSRYNAKTGQYETVVNPFGSATGTASGTDTGSGSVTDVIGQAISEGRITADQVTRYGIPFIAAALQKDPGYNFVTQKASITSDTASLKTQQAYADSTSRAFNTANANLSQLVSYMTQAGINTGSTVPIINELTNKAKAGLLDPGAVAAYQAALAGLRAEYAQVLSRGGEVTEGQRAQAASLIPDNLTPQQLQQVTDRLKIEGNNAITEANAKVKEIQGRIGSNTGGSSGSGSASTSKAGAGGLYDF